MSATSSTPAGLRPAAAPAWLAPLVDACAALGPEDVPFRRRGEGTGRQAAVLVLFGDGPDLLLTERAADLRTHAGQAAFPGGAHDADDPDLVATALREAAEETGLDPASVVPLAVLPSLTIPVTGFAVTAVLAHWPRPGHVGVVDPDEVAAVVRVPVRTLADPARRFRVSGPSGHVGPAFAAGGLLVWGFTAGVISWLFDLAGWSVPWDTTDVRDLDEAWSVRHEQVGGVVDPGRHAPRAAEGTQETEDSYGSDDTQGTDSGDGAVAGGGTGR